MTDPNADIVAAVDPRRGNARQLSDAERQQMSAEKKEALLSFLADLDAVCDPVVYYEDYDSSGIDCELVVC